MLLKVAPDGIVRVGQIAGGFRQVDRRLVGSVRILAGLDGVDKLAKILGDVVDSLEELRLALLRTSGPVPERSQFRDRS